jgi:LPXTG-motif cell wall-anchored protein
MAVEMLEKNPFYTFGREMNGSSANDEFRNFLPVFVAGGIVLGRKRKADKTRQSIADKYQSLRVDCDGIDSSISQVSNDLSTLKSSKPRKNKDERVWSIKVEETESVLRELQSAKRNLICQKDVATPPISGGSSSPVVVKETIPTVSTPTNGNKLDGTLGSGSAGSQGESMPKTNKNTILYIVLGVAAIGGIIYFMRKK